MSDAELDEVCQYPLAAAIPTANLARSEELGSNSSESRARVARKERRSERTGTENNGMSSFQLLPVINPDNPADSAKVPV